MVIRRELWLLSSLPTLGYSAFTQCYDDRSTRCSDPQGRFQEWWDKPIWHAKPGEGNLTVDNKTWGRATHFAVSAAGTVRKPPQEWITRRFTHYPERSCHPTPARSGVICYLPPYQPLALSATIRAGGWMFSAVRRLHGAGAGRKRESDSARYALSDQSATGPLTVQSFVNSSGEDVDACNAAGQWPRCFPGQLRD